MLSHNQIDLLLSWLNAFDANHLRNEDDVETKFVLPLFQYLGYSDAYRQGKYPIDDYLSEKGKRGRKNGIVDKLLEKFPAADQVRLIYWALA